jgi:hypothetical protein
MNTFINILRTGGLYVMFGIWSFVHVLEYKYFTRVEQYDTIIQNMTQCNQKYSELLIKIAHLENRVAELEDILILKDEIDDFESNQMNAEDTNTLITDTLITDTLITDTLITDTLITDTLITDTLITHLKTEDLKLETEDLKLETEDLKLETEDLKTEDLETETEDLELETETEDLELETETEDLETKIDEEMVYVSEETYPVKNSSQNKKGWIKTLLFM